MNISLPYSDLLKNIEKLEDKFGKLKFIDRFEIDYLKDFEEIIWNIKRKQFEINDLES